MDRYYSGVPVLVLFLSFPYVSHIYNFSMSVLTFSAAVVSTTALNMFDWKILNKYSSLGTNNFFNLPKSFVFMSHNTIRKQTVEN